jgi:hypothetical protein
MTTTVPTPRPAAIAAWHALMARHDMAALDGLLADDVVFESPVVHTPQAGRAKTAMYLRAADRVLNGDAFRYVGEWYAERSAVLAFQTEIDGIVVDGVDMIWWDDRDRIVRFKVMVRPLKAIGALHERMRAMLERMARGE